MELADALPLAAVLAAVLAPLAREYADFRSSGLSRAGAVATTLLVLPAVALGLVASLPLAATPAAQWGATVAVAIAAYSLGASAVRAAREPSRAPRRHA